MVSFNCFKFICKIAQLYVNEDGGWNVRATILVRRCHFPCFFNPLLHFWMDSNIPWIKIGKTLKHKKIQMFMNNLGCIPYNFTTSSNRKREFLCSSTAPDCVLIKCEWWRASFILTQNCPETKSVLVFTYQWPDWNAVGLFLWTRKQGSRQMWDISLTQMWLWYISLIPQM